MTTSTTTPPATPPAPTPGTPEHEAAIAAAFDKRTAEATGVTPPAPAVKPTKPEGVPDKFWNAEKGEVSYADWAKSTAELEKKLSQGATPPETPPATPPVVPPADDAAAKDLANKGLDLTEFNTEFADKGELSTESYDKLAKAGYDKALVDSYIAGQRALASSYDAAAFAVVGGEENYTKEVTWAKANMGAADQAAFNAAVSSGNEASMKLAVAGLHQAYIKANGTDPTLLGGGGTTPATGGFRSRAEQSAAINKTDDRGRKLYDIDPAYRADVAQRVATATFT